MEAAVDTSIWALLTAYVVRAPLFLVWAVVALAAITRWRMIPRQAGLALAAVAIMTLDALVGAYLAHSLPEWALRYWGPGQLSTLLYALAFLRSLVQAVAWSLMAWAALGRIVRPFEKG